MDMVRAEKTKILSWLKKIVELRQRAWKRADNYPENGECDKEK